MQRKCNSKRNFLMFGVLEFSITLASCKRSNFSNRHQYSATATNQDLQLQYTLLALVDGSLEHRQSSRHSRQKAFVGILSRRKVVSSCAPLHISIRLRILSSSWIRLLVVSVHSSGISLLQFFASFVDNGISYSIDWFHCRQWHLCFSTALLHWQWHLCFSTALLHSASLLFTPLRHRFSGTAARPHRKGLAAGFHRRCEFQQRAQSLHPHHQRQEHW